MSGFLVVAAGMPRAGSGWHYNLVHDLVVAAGGRDARQMRGRYLLGPILTEVNCNIRALSAPRLLPVMAPVWLGNSYAIKTHSGPSGLAERWIAAGRLRATYIYRDPRAALLSALEYGERARGAGRTNAFARLLNFEDGLDFMGGYVRIWERWMAVDGVHSLRYEDLMADYENEARRLAAFLGADAPSDDVVEVIARYRPGEAQRGEKGLHFRHGEAERFRDGFSKKELARANEVFGGWLERMGYAV